MCGLDDYYVLDLDLKLGMDITGVAITAENELGLTQIKVHSLEYNNVMTPLSLYPLVGKYTAVAGL